MNGEFQISSTQLLLDTLSLDLMKDCIKQQIDQTFIESIQTDFFSIVRGKYDLIIDDETIEPEVKTDIKYEMIQFCGDLINILDDRFNLCINDSFESLSTIECFDTLYEFFVINRTNYITEFFKNYIEVNKQSLITTLGYDEKEKDVTSISNRKKNLDKNNVMVVSHINEIINFIISTDVSPKTFLDTIDDGDVIIESMLDMLEDRYINGDFVNNYVCKVIGDYSNDQTSTIRNNLRFNFIK